MRFDVWDTIKVPFPYTNRPVQQHRPGLVVAQIEAAGAPALLWVLMITSADHRRWPGDVVVSDATAAGLPAPSVVRTAKTATIDASIAQRIGHIGEADQGQVRAHMTAILAATLAQSTIRPAATR